MNYFKKFISNLSKRSHIGLSEYITFKTVMNLHRSIRSESIRYSNIDITDIMNLYCDGYDNSWINIHSMSMSLSESIYQKSHNSHKLSDFK